MLSMLYDQMRSVLIKNAKVHSSIRAVLHGITYQVATSGGGHCVFQELRAVKGFLTQKSFRGVDCFLSNP